MPNRYILALIKSESCNDYSQDTNVARRAQDPVAERRAEDQSASRPDAEAGQLSFAFAS